MIDTEVPNCPLFEGVFKEIIFNWMQDNRVAKITVWFHGEGDNGSFDDSPSFYPIDETDPTAWNALYEKGRCDLVIPTPPGMPNETTIMKFVVHLSEEIEGKTKHNVDWYNNDGGNGVVEWILDGKGNDGEHYIRGICLTVSARIIEYDSHYYSIRGLVE